MADLPGPFCAVAASEAGEPLAGTSAEARVWILVEHDGAWAPKPLESPGLPTAVRDRLARWQKSVPGSRVQLIRGGVERARSSVTSLFVARVDEGDNLLLHFTLPSVEALLDLDLPAIVETGAHPQAGSETEPLFVVCTHGRRDPCCAKWGLPLFRALEAVAPSRVFQTTHVGGHRFAPNVVSLPHGMSFGRVDPSEAEALVTAHRRGEMHDVSRLRGRSLYAPPTQAAEFFLRDETGERRLDALRHLGTEELDASRVRVRFSRRGHPDVAIVVEEIESEVTRPASCGEPGERMTFFRRVPE